MEMMDKTSSVVGAAMEYLQQRVTALEEEANEMMILPEIKARICNQSILVKIRCGKRKGRIVDIIGEVENLNLAILNFNVATFAAALDFTIVAKMEGNESSLSEADIVTAIRDMLLYDYESGISV